MLTQTLGTKAINLLANIALAWLLLEEDFGLVGLAYSFMVIAAVLQTGAIEDVLAHRHASFRRWSSPAVWMSLTMGFGNTLILLAAAPVAAAIYGRSELQGMISILALSPLAGSLAVVPNAKLRNDLRYRTLAAVGLSSATALIVGRVLLAWLGFGAYSFVLPEPFVWSARAALLWWIARPPLRRTPQLRRWRYLIGDSLTSLAGNVVVTVALLGDCFVLGLWHPAAVVGVYYFALRNSTQTIHLFTLNLANVLLPALSKLQSEARRQSDAFLRASRVLAVGGVPLCLLQAGVADPVVRLLFEPRWYDAIAPLQILSVGMALRLLTEPTYSMLKAQGRFATYLRLALASTGLYYAMVLAGAALAGAVGVAAGVAATLIVFGPIQLRLAIGPGGGGWREVWRVYAPPLLCGAVAVGVGVLAASWIERGGSLHHLARIGVTGGVGLACYVALIRRAAPGDWRELRDRVDGLRRRGRGSASG
jgi:PST family polysaccharide transporter